MLQQNSWDVQVKFLLSNIESKPIMQDMKQPLLSAANNQSRLSSSHQFAVASLLTSTTGISGAV